MAIAITMPKMSDTMTEGVIAAWHKKVGDKVKEGDLLAEVETDKATMELESYESGTLLYIGTKQNEAALVDGIIAIVGEPGEDFSALLGKSDAPKAEPAKQEATPEAVVPKVDTSNIKATVVTMPKMSDTMTEGTIEAWHKKVGDKVKSGELLAEVATDKATMELESYEDGILLYIGVEAGKAIAVDGVIAVIGEAGADFQALLNNHGAPVAAKAESVSTPVAAKAEVESAPVANTSAPEASASTSSDSRIKASPLAKAIAKEKGIDLTSVSGSGEFGRIVKKDLDNASAPKVVAPTVSAPAKSNVAPAVGVESYDEVPVNSMRKTIARRLGESLFTAPHFSLTMEINMDKAIEARKSINDFMGGKVSFNDMVIKAVAAAIRKNPKVNSSWLGDKVRYNHHIHIGVAVAVEDGLLVPVIRFADSRSLTQINEEVKDLAGKAKNKQLQPKDWEGNTFTISNLGMFGIEEFTSIINQPDTCILSVGAIKQTAIVKDNQLVIGNVMKVTLTCDHRVVDGAVGSGFLVTLKGLLEYPVIIIA